MSKETATPPSAPPDGAMISDALCAVFDARIRSLERTSASVKQCLALFGVAADSPAMVQTQLELGKIVREGTLAHLREVARLIAVIHTRSAALLPARAGDDGRSGDG